MAIEVLGVEHIDLTVNDVARSRAFYDKVLGELGFRKFEGADYIHWANAQMTIAIRDASGANRSARFDRYRVGLHHLAFRARSRADVEAFHDFLVREKIEVLDAPAEYPQYGENYYAVFFADPDGIKLELVHFPWGYWRKVQTDGHDARPRYEIKSRIRRRKRERCAPSRSIRQRAYPRIHRVRTASCAVQPLLDYYFVRKEKRSGAVIELHQEHAPVEIINLTQDAWLFAESTATLVVAHRFLQLAMLSDQFFCIYARHHIFTPPLPFRYSGHHHPDRHTSKLRA